MFQALNCGQFVIWLRTLYLVENRKDLIVLAVHVKKAQLLSLVFTNKLAELRTVLNFVQALDKFVCEGLYPFDVFVLDLNERVSDLSLPLSDNVNVRVVFLDRFLSKSLDSFEIFKCSFVVLVNVLKVFLRNDAFETLILLLLSGPESCWSIVSFAVDPEGTFGILLIGVHQERLVDYILTQVPFHVMRGFLLLFCVNEFVDHVKSCRVVFLAGRQLLYSLRSLHLIVVWSELTVLSEGSLSGFP